MKIAISGYGRSGKDTVAERLRDCSPLRYINSTSWLARHFVYEAFKGIHDYPNAEECWNDRHSHRDEWAALIGKYNRHDPIRLYRECLKEQDILVGVRWRREMLACRAAGLVDLWIWVDRPGVEYDRTQEFTAGECDLTIVNDSTWESLQDKVERVASAWFSTGVTR